MVPCDIRANLSSTATADGIATGTELGNSFNFQKYNLTNLTVRNFLAQMKELCSDIRQHASHVVATSSKQSEGR